VKSPVITVAVLLFGSGMCALIYQIAWLRELKLVFGGSTAASAAVLATFMAGLGLGGAFLGRIADRQSNPLAFYSRLEMFVSAFALLSLPLIWGVRELYILSGGSLAMGINVATVVRLALTGMVLGLPTFFMGGTLPAAVRAVETSNDSSRHHLATLYGFNTIGAVFGASIATFFMLETVGTRYTLIYAAVVNLIIALIARSISRYTQNVHINLASEKMNTLDTISATDSVSAKAPTAYIYFAAAAVGFVFLLMELVWYRMLGTLLGGTTFTFGLILAVALLGIGMGSALYSLRGEKHVPTLFGFAITIALEAVFIAAPFALGDYIAILSHILRDLSALGFYGLLVGWTAVAAIVILPAAIVSGYQFPLLIALLGRGQKDVGRHTGNAYAWNTAGAIGGSLAGGFGLIPLLSAIGVWTAVVYALAVLSAITMLVAYRHSKEIRHFYTPAILVAIAILLVVIPLGPTAAWRHNGIGAGRSGLNLSGNNELRNSLHKIRRSIHWEKDGRESSLALATADGYAFVVNGKVDGNAIEDASTQVMLGMISAILHPEPKRSMVIGMGTGSSAGWLAQIDSMERVDVVELESDILTIAEWCAPVNENLLENSKFHFIEGDAREIVLTARDKYDLIASEPSNPYRAGIASLYTLEFYSAVAKRLNDGGIFTQWVQAYEIDAQTVRTILATLSTVFPSVEIWQTKEDDMVMVCSQKPIKYSVSSLRQRTQQEPFARALYHAWHVDDLEGMLAHYVAGNEVSIAIREKSNGILNTDDRMLVEFGFGRSVGRDMRFSLDQIRSLADRHESARPAITESEVDWQLVEDHRVHHRALWGSQRSYSMDTSDDQRTRTEATKHFLALDYAECLSRWNAQRREPTTPFERWMIGLSFARTNDKAALAIASLFEEKSPIEASVIRATYHVQQSNWDQAVSQLNQAFLYSRTSPWTMPFVLETAFALAQEVGDAKPALASRMIDALSLPFSCRSRNEKRMFIALHLASKTNAQQALPIIKAFEPHVPWNRNFLEFRKHVYQETEDSNLQNAIDDQKRFYRSNIKTFSDLIVDFDQQHVNSKPTTLSN